MMIEIDEYDEPYEVARKLIDAKHIVVKKIVTLQGGKEVEREEPVFDTSELLKIGKHLMSYAKIERENSWSMEHDAIEL